MRYGRAINRVGWRVVKRFSRDFGAEGMELRWFTFGMRTDWLCRSRAAIDANGRIKVDYRSSGGGWGQNLTLAEAAALVKVLNELIEAGHRQVAERYKNAMAALMRAIEDKWDDIDEDTRKSSHQPEQRRYLGGICDGIDQAAVLLDHVCERFKLDKPGQPERAGQAGGQARHD